jgi:hypothetical protein
VRCQEALGEMPRAREVAAFLLREQERAREGTFGEMPRSDLW